MVGYYHCVFITKFGSEKIGKKSVNAWQSYRPVRHGMILLTDEELAK